MSDGLTLDWVTFFLDDRYCFDDSRVSQVKASSISSAEAYVLYFQMVDGNPPPATEVVQRPLPSDSDSEDEQDESDEAEVAVPPESDSGTTTSDTEDDDVTSTSSDGQ